MSGRLVVVWSDLFTHLFFFMRRHDCLARVGWPRNRRDIKRRGEGKSIAEMQSPERAAFVTREFLVWNESLKSKHPADRGLHCARRFFLFVNECIRHRISWFYLCKIRKHWIVINKDINDSLFIGIKKKKKKRLQWIILGLVMSLVGLEPQPQRYSQPSWNVPAHPNGIPHPLHRPPSPGKQQGAFQQTRNHVTRQDSDHCAINIPGRNGSVTFLPPPPPSPQCRPVVTVSFN